MGAFKGRTWIAVMTRTGTTQAAEPTVALGGLPSPASFMVATSGAGRGDHAATLKAVKVASTGKRRRVKGRPNQALRGNVVDKPEANVEDHPFAHDLAAEGNAQGPRRRMTMVPALLAVVGSLARTSPLGIRVGRSDQLKTSHLEGSPLEMAGKAARQPVAEEVRPPAMVQRPLQGASSRRPLQGQLLRALSLPEGCNAAWTAALFFPRCTFPSLTTTNLRRGDAPPLGASAARRWERKHALRPENLFSRLSVCACVCLVGYQSFNDVIARWGWQEEAFYTQVYFKRWRRGLLVLLLLLSVLEQKHFPFVWLCFCKAVNASVCKNYWTNQARCKGQAK